MSAKNGLVFLLMILMAFYEFKLYNFRIFNVLYILI